MYMKNKSSHISVLKDEKEVNRNEMVDKKKNLCNNRINERRKQILGESDKRSWEKRKLSYEGNTRKGWDAKDETWNMTTH